MLSPGEQACLRPWGSASLRRVFHGARRGPDTIRRTPRGCCSIESVTWKAVGHEKPDGLRGALYTSRTPPLWALRYGPQHASRWLVRASNLVLSFSWLCCGVPYHAGMVHGCMLLCANIINSIIQYSKSTSLAPTKQLI